MRLITHIKYFLVIISIASFGQQKNRPIFSIWNKITTESDLPQIHSLWEGMKNPLKITCNDSKIKFSVQAKGVTIVNRDKNGGFDLIPFQEDLTLFCISTNNDTLHSLDFHSRKMIMPTFQFLLGKREIKDNDPINKNLLSLLSLNLLPDSTLKEDLIELPIYKIDKVEIILVRDSKLILSVNSFSGITSIKTNAKSGDDLFVIISSYSYTNALNESITPNKSRTYRFKVI